MGLLYLGKILEEQGEKVTFLDFCAEKFEEHKLTSVLSSVDIVGISLISTSVEKANHIIQIIKEKDSSLPIIIGGPHCTLFPKKALKETNTDICVQGDGEKIIKDINKTFHNGKSLSEIPGVYYRINDIIKQGPRYRIIDDLNSIPFPARHLSKKYTYGLAFNPKIKKGEFTTLITSRGCPFNCTFCSRGSASMYRYRTRSTENILNEIREIYDMGYKYIAIMDDAFLTNKDQVYTIFDTLIKEKIDMKFYITASRPDDADVELYKKMKQAGVIRIQYGLESGNQDILDFYNKKTTVEKIRNGVYLSHKTGFFTAGTFVIGAPFETKKHFNNTLKLAKSLPLDAVAFLSLRYMVGSELWSKAVNNGKIAPDEYFVLTDSNRDLALFTQDEIDTFCKNAQRAFYYRPKFIINLLKSSLERNDFAFLQIITSIFLSNIKKQLFFWKQQKGREFKPYQETNL